MMRKKNRKPSLYLDETALIGPDLHFAASEAYKLLRTNILFSLPDEKQCRIIGITSSISGEGKSTTAINLAYTVAETGKKVLLMELDMRLPTIAKRLSVRETPGLSNFLAGLTTMGDIQQPSGIHENLFVITSGDIPPNPSELLGAREMAATVEYLSKSFDFIFFDLPPVNVVSDALVVSKLTHGMIMVVRQNYNNQRELSEAMRQLKIVDAKVLGFVLSRGEVRDAKYKNKKYRKQGYEYGYGYGYGRKPVKPERPEKKND